ncbi:hypothetical protein NQZ68_020806 [Dissostichus eleginoides]|uniref:Junctional adhesion molecule 2A n=1 Tax=Dissostichus eleginoides TaxID=100907 RepID=A0AAD9BAL8_DISEL|nr:hypothetical protein NQZ68_020806 [Dissostichus eleginoides]KAK1879706.1 Junctional adhesion molecule 2A [Dissostichus eleginoides]
MRRQSHMLLLLVSLLYLSPAEGGCSRAIVIISGDDRLLSSGEGFNLSCEFSCLRAHHVAQLWRSAPQEGDTISAKESMSLVNMSSALPDVILVLRIRSATPAHSGDYSCMTQPPDTISPKVSILIADNLTTSSPAPSSSPLCDSSQQHSRATALQGQLWYWILLGKAALLLFSLACLAVKYKRA